MQFQLRAALLLSLALPLVACGESDSRELLSEADRQLQRGDPEGAADSFDAALRGLKDSERDLRTDAVIGKCEALAHFDGERSAREFLRLADNESLGYNDYSLVVQRLSESGFHDEALTLLEHARTRLPEESRIVGLVHVVGRASERALAGNEGASAALDRLAGLGYVGSDGNEDEDPDGER